jgi:hypothetical protein
MRSCWKATKRGFGQRGVKDEKIRMQSRQVCEPSEESLEGSVSPGGEREKCISGGKTEVNSHENLTIIHSFL